jgi:hypothetical protein
MLTFGLVALAACGPTSDPADQHDAAAQQDGTLPQLDGGGGSPDSGVCEDVVDVVFVLDVSSSMDFVLDKLDAEIASVVTAATALKPEPHFGLVAFVDNFKLDDTGPLGGGVIHTTADTLRAAFQHYKNTYTTPNRNPGDGPTGPTLQNPICEENAVDALYAAASTFPWRETASRVVIVVTDDTFLERPDNYGDRDGDGLTDKTDFPREGNYPAQNTMAEAIDALRFNRARVFSFTRLQEPGPFSLSKCSTGRRLPWSSVSAGWSAPYGGQQPIPERTGGSNFDVEKVRDGTLSLSATINEVVLSSYCNPPIY